MFLVLQDALHSAVIDGRGQPMWPPCIDVTKTELLRFNAFLFIKKTFTNVKNVGTCGI